MSYECMSDAWLYKHKSNLALFKNDLDLIIRNDFKLYVAIDFYDIFRYSFDMPEFSNTKKRKYFDNDRIRNVFFRNQIARSTAFLLLQKIYRKPDLLLPSYLIECNDVLTFLEQETFRFFDRENRLKLEEMSNTYFDTIKGKDVNYDELVEYLNQNAPGLIYYFSRGLANGITTFFHVLRNYLTDDLDTFGIDFQNDKIDLFSIINNLNSDQSLEYMEVKDIVWNARKKDYKIAQNNRDAEAIYTTIRLNEIYNKDRKAFILISSASHMNKVIRNDKYGEFTIKVGSKDFPILRGMDYFLSILLSMANFKEYHGDKNNLDEIDLKSLRQSVSKDQSKLEEFFVLGTRVGGVLLKQLRDDLSGNITSINNLRNNIDLALLINQFLPEDMADNTPIEKIVDYNARLYTENQKRTAKLLRDAFSDGTLTSKLLDRYKELERIQLTYFLNAIRSRQKALYVVLFSNPFRLNINDPISQRLIDQLSKYNIKGKINLKEQGFIPEDVIQDIYQLLKDLLERADQIDQNERLIIWQLVFLFLGRYNHVDDLYDSFIGDFSKSQKIESAYLKVVNFIRKMRRSKISDEDLFLEIIKLCDCHGDIYLGRIERNITLDMVNLDTDVLIGTSGNRLELPPTLEMRRLSEDLIAFNTKNNQTFLGKKDNNGICIFQIDIRFIHARSVIFNRYFSEFGCANREYISKLKRKFETIFIPLANTVEPNFKIAIESDYAYLLSLDRLDENYHTNLSKSLGLMNDLMDESEQTVDIYWGYVRNYILGYIYLALAEISQIRYQGELLENSLIYFNKSLKELPELADYLRLMVIEKIGACNDKLALLDNL